MKWLRGIWKKYNECSFVIHPLFIIFAIFCFMLNKSELILIYTSSALLHELGHFFVARKLGYKFMQLRLMPYGAELFGENDQFVRYDEVIIAIAGPITNFIICVLCVTLWWLVPNTYYLTLDFCVASLVLGLFNIIPIFPLDGGRIVLCVLAQRLQRKNAVKICKIGTQVFAVILFGVCLLSFWFTFNFSIGAVAVLLFFSSITNNKRAGYERIFNEKYKQKLLNKGIEENRIVIKASVPLYKAYRIMRYNKYNVFIVLEENNSKSFEVNEHSVLNEINKGNWNQDIKHLKDTQNVKYY